MGKVLRAVAVGSLLAAMMLAGLMPSLSGMLLVAGLVAAMTMLVGASISARASPMQASMRNACVTGDAAGLGWYVARDLLTSVGGWLRTCMATVLAFAMAIYAAISTRFFFSENSCHHYQAFSASRASPLGLAIDKKMNCVRSFRDNLGRRRHDVARSPLHARGLGHLLACT